MPKFTVRVTGSAVVWKDVEVEAETAEAALEAVNDGQVEDIEQQHGWELSEGGNGVDDWETTGDVYDDEGEAVMEDGEVVNATV